MKKIIKIIIIVLVFILSGALIGYIIFKLNNKNDSNILNDNKTQSIKSDEEYLKELIANVNKINANFIPSNLSTTDSYEKNNDYSNKICYRYKGSNLEEVLDLIEKTYYILDNDSSMLDIVTSKEGTTPSKRILYVCLPTNCDIKKIDKYELISNDIQNTKLVKLNDNHEEYLKIINNDWKFYFPVDMC